ncbi:uncharacterized protein LOC129581698 [Paramacrobiotus metropolitanus]|uniref:uncharacterized protein LOC129581698 n=1 Tax=Paramacrobiotus metropolitanus TaxID=2943436 RepID=UPI0024464107|nr:uncharacterized protein LOC129581698 [Paramacrobiotus metropolitanus]XP_055328885.1 uncharacterized protein LOC129581698 [Paramacrobiotus metropolitanus]
MSAVERTTFHCVIFTPRKNQTNYVHFVPGENCSSFVGVLGGRQPVFLHPAKCIQLGRVQHEILHALGLYHEHSRPDRNASVIINDEEIMENYISQYSIIPDMPTFGTAYDLDSLMHYGPYDFAKTTDRPVIVPRHEGVYRMGQRDGLSVRDAAKLRNAYRCQVEQGHETDNQEPMSTGFSGLPMQAAQCALQFTRYCKSSTTTRENCTSQSSLNIECEEEADAAHLRVMALAMAAAPLRPVNVALLEQQFTVAALSPVERQVLTLIMQNCRVRDPTERFGRFSFVNLQQIIMRNCMDIRIKKADFQLMLMLKVVIFMEVTIVYLEEGTFTSLPELRILAWHKDLLYNFGTIGLDYSDNDSEDDRRARSRCDYLQRMHCDCEFAWLRKWLRENDMLTLPTADSLIFYYSNTSHITPGITLNRNDIYIPIDCALQPFPSDFSVIDFTQREFSIHEPQCPLRTHNASYSRMKWKRTFSAAPIDAAQCRLQFGLSCKPGDFRFAPRQDRKTAIVEYCEELFRSSTRTLYVGCTGDTKVRDAQEVAFALAKPLLRPIYLILADGPYIVYRAFAPIRTQVLKLHFHDCVDQRPTAKLSDLDFANLLYMAIASCSEIIVQSEDFSDLVDLRVLLFQRTTVIGVSQFTFTALSNLQLLSLEYTVQDRLNLSANYYQYLRRLHCDCQYSQFRSWLQRRIIDPMSILFPNEMVISDLSVRDVCGDRMSNIATTIVAFEYDTDDAIGFHRERYCWKKEELYAPFDCSKAKADNPRGAIDHTYIQINYSVSAPSCGSSVAGNCSTTPSEWHDCKVHNRSAGGKAASAKEWISSINQPILNERRSELTIKAIDGTGNTYYYDDQELSSNPASESGNLPDSRFWSTSGTAIPYSVSEAFSLQDIEAIQDALLSISSSTSQCIKFKIRKYEEDYISFWQGQRCQSSVGKQGGQQNITLAEVCIFRGAIQHLVLHALGLFHEHHRADRDGYLRIYFNRTQLPPTSIFFRKLPQMASYGTEYDLESIMHYGVFDLASPENPDLPVFFPKAAPKKGKGIKMGQRRSLSAKDIVKLYSAYNCSRQRSQLSVAEPLPEFGKDNLTQPMCNALSTLKCNVGDMENCLAWKTIQLVCGSNTTVEDWNQAAVTVAKIPLRAIRLHLLDSRERYAAPDAFQPIRRQIVVAMFIRCRDCRFTSVLSVFGLVSVMDIALQLCYGLVIRKADFYGLQRLQVLTFVSSTLRTLEPETFSTLSSLEVLSLEFDLLNPTCLLFNVTRSQQLEYLHRLHCSCDFADFRRWRKTNKALREEVEAGEIMYVEGALGSGPFRRSDLFYPVDCLADLLNDTDAAINFTQLEYSVNEPLCEPRTIPATSSYDRDLCSSADADHPLIAVKGLARSIQVTIPGVIPVSPSPVNEAAAKIHSHDQSRGWVYGCIGGVVGLGVISFIYVVWRGIRRRNRRAAQRPTLESGQLLSTSVAVVERVEISMSSIDLTHPFSGDVEEVSDAGSVTTAGTELQPLTSDVPESDNKSER